MKKNHISNITAAGLIAALYTVLCLIVFPVNIAGFQLRLAEALCVLPYFTPSAIPGLVIGCLLGNFCTGADILDIFFGSLATLIGATITFMLRRHKYLAPLPPILSNMLILPFVLKYAYSPSASLAVLAVGVGLSEILTCGVLGLPLLLLLERYRKYIFPYSGISSDRK